MINIMDEHLKSPEAENSDSCDACLPWLPAASLLGQQWAGQGPHTVRPMRGCSCGHFELRYFVSSSWHLDRVRSFERGLLRD